MWEVPPARERDKSKNQDLCSHLPRTVQTLESTGCSVCTGRLLLVSKTDVFAYSPV